MTQSPESTNAATLAAYEAGAGAYVEGTPATPPDRLTGVFNLLATHVRPPATLLEIGSATGRDADLLEERGYAVTRTDAATSFVNLLRRRGLAVDRLNVLTDEVRGVYDVIYANAVFLHFSRGELVGVLARMLPHVRARGLLVFTVKGGTGEGWSTHKLDLPRHFTYWQEPALRRLVASTGWQVLELTVATGADTEWLTVIARPAV
ncbi:class I SAM-dependent methyltransferase [Oryzihumus leptocrescens]|uniref:Methyltransferase family protein n=1 Tax=Oryzihumus leptocrescens TaxID=297536 RepID=A0A542ZLR1_9MICO|nr:methyltransferase domain-containing protein [Oryzihumus leptocrescens]TQL61120.1 methyltransferase family protein [Oryzihumus leptocrescens]